MNVLSKICDDRDVYESMKKLNVEFNKVMQTLHLQISGAELQQGSVRAEFRLKLSDFTSVAKQLESIYLRKSFKLDNMFGHEKRMQISKFSRNEPEEIIDLHDE